MTKEKFIEIINSDPKELTSYEDRVVQGAEHDMLYSEDIEVLISAGINEAEVQKLRDLNWWIESNDYLCRINE